MGFFKKIFSREKKEKLDEGLQKTKEGVWQKISRAVAGKSTVDDDVLDNLEEAFATSDVGVDTTLEIIDRLQARVKRDKYVSVDELHNLLCEEVTAMIAPESDKDPELGDFEVPRDGRPYVILVVGVNGVGKTTTIGKLAHQYAKAGNKVYLAASDTFRAAAIEQLQTWGDRAGVTVVKQQMGSDPAAVAYDTVAAAKAHDADVSTGQNAYEQAEQFAEVTPVNALAVTKLDGTAKGGVVIGISYKHRIPIKYLGLGEGIDDLQIFNPKEFVRSLFIDEKKES